MAEVVEVQPRRIAIAAAVDTVAILLFVMIGRNSHEGGSAVGDTLAVAGPFIIALFFGWLEAQAWRAPTAVSKGVQIWLVTIVAGMLLRRFAFDRGTALSFIIVASLFTLLLLVGWRVVNEWLAGRGKPSI